MSRYDGPVTFIGADLDRPAHDQGHDLLHVGYRRVGLRMHKRQFAQLKRGWHYSMKRSYRPALVEKKPGVWGLVKLEDWVPDKPLHLNDLAGEGDEQTFKGAGPKGSLHHADPARLFYEYAEPHHASWVEKHGHGTVRPIEGQQIAGSA